MTGAGVGQKAGIVTFLALLGCGPPPPAPTAENTASDDFWITDVRLIDGLGTPARPASVHVRDGLVAEVRDAPPADGTTVDGGGLVLAPGFIDTHSHADMQFDTARDAFYAVSQGITTVVVGQDGASALPLADFFAGLEERPVAVHVASFSGHGTLRSEVMGEDFRRPATAEEVSAMSELLRRDMEAGAIGLATGLEYDPGIYSETEEVVALARVAAAYGGRYTSHVRSEDRRFWAAIEEILEIGREAQIPVQVSHVKLAMRSHWGQAERLLARLDEARAEGVDVSADIYPYTRWQTTLMVLFPERDYEDRDEAVLATTEVASPETMLIPRFDPDPALAGKTLAQIAAERGRDAASVLLELVRDIQVYAKATGKTGFESVIAESMNEDDIRRLLQWPFTNICTDGSLDPEHPRGAGTFPRVLRQVREDSVLPLEEAVRRMTSLAARNAGLTGRGVVAPGAPADLVLFDPDTVTDRATFEDPQRPSEGIARVWVAGTEVFRDGRTTGAFPGRALRRPTEGTP